MRPYTATTPLTTPMMERASRYADIRYFVFLTLFVLAFLTAGYLALWMPLIARLRL